MAAASLFKYFQETILGNSDRSGGGGGGNERSVSFASSVTGGGGGGGNGDAVVVVNMDTDVERSSPSSSSSHGFGEVPVLATHPIIGGGGGLFMRSVESLMLDQHNMRQYQSYEDGCEIASMDRVVVDDRNFYRAALFYALNSYGRTEPRVGGNHTLWAYENCRYEQRYITANCDHEGSHLRLRMRSLENPERLSTLWWDKLVSALTKHAKHLKPADFIGGDDDVLQRWRQLTEEKRCDAVIYRTLCQYNHSIGGHGGSRLVYGQPVMFPVSVSVAFDAPERQRVLAGQSVGAQYAEFAQWNYTSTAALGGTYVVYAVEFAGIRAKNAVSELTVEVLVPNNRRQYDAADAAVWKTKPYDPSLSIVVPKGVQQLGGKTFWSEERTMVSESDQNTQRNGRWDFLIPRYNGGTNTDPMALNEFAARHPRAHDMVPWFLLDSNYVTCDVETLLVEKVVVFHHGPPSYKGSAIDDDAAAIGDGSLVEVDADAPVVPWLQFLMALSSACNGWSDRNNVVYCDLLSIPEDDISPAYDRARARRLNSAYERINTLALKERIYPLGVADLCIALRKTHASATGDVCYLMHRAALEAAVKLLISERQRTLKMLDVCRLADVGVRVMTPYHYTDDNTAGARVIESTGMGHHMSSPMSTMGGGGGNSYVYDAAPPAAATTRTEVDVSFNVYAVFLRYHDTDQTQTQVEIEHAKLKEPAPASSSSYAANNNNNTQRQIPPPPSSSSSLAYHLQ